MVVLAHQQRDLLGLPAVGNLPFHVEAFRDRGEALSKLFDTARDRVRAYFLAHEENAVAIVRMMVGFGDPSALFGEEGAHRRHDADAVGAFQGQY